MVVYSILVLTDYIGIICTCGIFSFNIPGAPLDHSGFGGTSVTTQTFPYTKHS